MIVNLQSQNFYSTGHRSKPGGKIPTFLQADEGSPGYCDPDGPSQPISSQNPKETATPKAGNLT
jgi:hypothetical protein